MDERSATGKINFNSVLLKEYKDLLFAEVGLKEESVNEKS